MPLRKLALIIAMALMTLGPTGDLTHMTGGPAKVVATHMTRQTGSTHTASTMEAAHKIAA
jgi:hypothetical protein